MKYCLLLCFLFSSLVFSQEYKIEKIIDTNLFGLSNKQQVTIYGIEIPSLTDTNSSYSNLAKEIISWEEDRLLNRSFLLEFVDTINNIKVAKIYNTLGLGKENISRWFLINGYASVKAENEDYNNLIYYQRKSIENQRGIWKFKSDIGLISPKIIETGKVKYERPNFPIIFLGLASFALAWDSFSSVGDLQETINSLKRLSPNIDVTELETSKTRKTIVGVTCLIAGIAATFFSLQSVEIKTDLRSLHFQYRF